MDSRTCTRCNQTKLLEQFRRGSRVCLDCMRADRREYMRKRRQEFPELIKEQKQRSYRNFSDQNSERNHNRYLAERERRLNYAAEYRAKHRERLKIWHREYRKANPEKRNQKDRDSYQRHRDQRLAYREQYRQNNRIAIRLHNRTRKVHLKYARADFTPQDWARCLDYWHNACAVCGAQADDSRTIAADHWIPLNAGGLTDKSNIVPLCHGFDGCNNRKRDHMPLDWLIRQLGAETGQRKAQEIAAYFANLE